MLPHIFAKVFKDEVTRQQASLTEVAGSRAGHYTTWFSDDVVPKIAESLGLNVHWESYPARIDYVLSRDTGWPHRLDIAIEHEKTGDTAEQEIAKLVLVTSGFAVLVTYIKAEHEHSYLKRYLDIISRLEMLDAFGKQRGFLLILGQHDPWKAVTPENSVAWRFFSLEGENWKLMDGPSSPQATVNSSCQATAELRAPSCLSGIAGA